MHVYLDNTPPKLVHSLVSDPGGGGVLHLVSEPKVYEIEQKFLKKSFKNLLKNYFQNRL